MAEPAEAPLAENGKYAPHVGTIQDLCVGNFVLQLDVQNASQAPQVEAVEFPVLARVGGPCLAAVEEYIEHAGQVDVHFGLHKKTGHNCFSLAITAAALEILLFTSASMESELADGGPGVSEGVLEEHGEEDTEESRGKDEAIFHSTTDWEGLRCSTIETDRAVHVLVERGDNRKQVLGAANLLQQPEESAPTDHAGQTPLSDL